MPKYIINTSKGAFEVEADREPTREEGEQYVSQLMAAQEAPVVKEPQPQAQKAPEGSQPLREATAGEIATGVAIEAGAPLTAGIIGTAVGGPILGALAAGGAGALGSYGRQRLEQKAGTRESISLGEIAAAGLTSVVPAALGAKAVLGAKGLFTPAIIRATQGGATAVSAEVVKNVIDKGELPTWEEIVVPAAVGTVAGGALGAVEKRYQMAGNLIANPIAAQAAQVGTGLGVGAYVYNDAIEQGDTNALPKAVLYASAAYGATHIPSLIARNPDIRQKVESTVLGPDITLGKQAVRGIEAYQNQLKAAQNEATNLGLLIKKEIEKSKNPQQLTADVLQALDDKSPTSVLPDGSDIKAYVDRTIELRSQNAKFILDNFGDALPEGIRSAIKKNDGGYLRTAYAAHDPNAKRGRDFDRKEDREIFRKKLINDLTQQAADKGETLAPAAAGAEADAIMARMLNDVGYLWSNSAPIKIGGGGPTSPLRHKGQLSEEARNWLGEVKDPAAKVANSLHAQARLVMHEVHDQQMREMLLPGGKEGIGSLVMKPGYVKLVGPDAPMLHRKLADIYVPEVWAKAYQEMLSPNLLGDSTVAKSWVTMQGLSKSLKTVGNLPEAIAPQVIGNLVIAASSFKLNPMELVRAAKTTAQAYGWSGGKVTGEARVKMLKEFKRLEALGVIKTGAEAQELNAFIDQSVTGKGFKDVMKKFSNIYGFPDTFVRYAIFKQNVDEIKSFNLGLGTDQIEKMAADLTNDTFPTYERIAKRFRQASAIGVANAFGAFEYEVVRTTVNQAKYASKLLLQGMQTGNVPMAVAGAKRALALGSVAATTAGLATYGSSLLGSSPQDVKDMSRIGPVFDKGKAIIGKVNDDGTFAYAPINYMMPYANMMSTLNEALNGRNPLPYLKTTFLGDDLGPLLTSTTEAITNTYYGTKVAITEPRDNIALTERLLSRAFLPQFITGTLSRVEKAYRGETNKLGTKYTYEDQLLRFGGYRSNRMDILGSAAVRIRDVAQPLGEELTGYKRLIKNRIDPETGQFVGVNEDAIYRERNARYMAGQDELSEIYRAMKRLSAKSKDITDDKIINAFKAAGVPNRLIAAAIFGYKVPMPRGIEESDSQIVESVMLDPEKRGKAREYIAAKAGQDKFHRARLMEAYATYKENEGKKVDGVTKLFGGLGVTDGERAKNIKWTMDSMPEEARRPFLNKLLRTGVATDEVMRQLADFRRQEAQRQQGL